MARLSKVQPAGGPRSLRAALARRGWEMQPGCEIREYFGRVHRSNGEANRVLRGLGLTDPGDRRYFRLPQGADHQIPQAVFDVIGDNGRHPADDPAALADYRDL